MSTREVVAKIWVEHGHDAAALDRLDLTGRETVLPSSFAVGTAMQAAVAASALAAAEVWRERTGRAQRAGIDMRAAGIAARSERYFTVDGKPAPELWDKIAGTYQCGDGRWVRLHTNFPHHRDGVLKLLGCAYDKAAVAEALRGWTAFDLEEAAARNKLVVTAMRTFAEWDAHPQGQAVAQMPLLSIDRIGAALPAQILDHATGYLMAFAAMTALLRRSREGGSWHAQLSLAQTGFWLRSLGRIDGLGIKDPAREDVSDCLEDSESGFGRLSAVRHPATLSETPPFWARPTVPLGTHAPCRPREG